MRPVPKLVARSPPKGMPVARYAVAGADPQRRADYTERIRFLAERFGHLGPQCPWPAELASLAAGESVPVPGWQVGLPGTDYSFYMLNADGTLTPYERHKISDWS